MASDLRLVNRGECPALLNLTGLAEDPDLQHYIRARVRQLQSDFRDDTIFLIDEKRHQECSCSSSGISHWSLAKKIKANGNGWQDELAQSLLSYVMCHLSASIVENIIKVFIVNGRLKWRDYAPCVEKHNRSDPMLVLEAGGRAIQARFMLQNKALQNCAVKGAFLNVIKKHWAHCEFFREGREGRFPKHDFQRHELFLEAMRKYAENPSSDTFHSAASVLSWSLASKSCPLSYTHPALHSVEYGPAFEHSGNIKASRSFEADVGK